MNPKYWLVLASFAVVGALQLAACSSKFSSCQASRSCPAAAGRGGEAGDSSETGAGTGGMGTAGADAGASGEAGASAVPSVECSRDADCGDHLACNGVESCKEGLCVPGVSPCSNPDDTRCQVACTEVKGAALCALRGRDDDKDGHFSTGCAANPGNDCDDSNDTVYLGAPEICDGLDNDCNGKIDMSDGLPPGGTTVTIGPEVMDRGFASIAWAPDKSVYGIVYSDRASSAAGDLYFEEVDQTGATVLAPRVVNEVATKGAYTPALVWGGDGFGLAWTSADSGHFRLISSAGVLSPHKFDAAFQDHTVKYHPEVARLPGGPWALLFDVLTTENQNEDSLIALTLSADASPVSNGSFPIVTPDARSWQIAATTSFVTVIGHGAAPRPPAEAAVWDSSFSTSKSLSVVGSAPVIGAGTKGFAIATQGVTASDKPSVSLFDSGGSPVCGPISFAENLFRPTSIVATPRGYLIASGFELRVQEVAADCSLGALFTVDSGFAESARIVGGSDGYGIVWFDDNKGVPRLRILGPRLCD